MATIKTKVIGAGSIGNHLSQASRRAGWDVCVVDTNSEALQRMKEDIYPTRYGKWDDAIKLYESKDEPIGGFDVIYIGTPPDVHLTVATKILKEEAPRVLQVEKPFCSPTLEGLGEFLDELSKHPDTMIIVGYDHVLGKNTLEVEKLIKANDLGKLLTLDADMRFHWGAILKAHPWLKGPSDTYLGFWQKGGGAGGEHSHGLNLWQHLSHFVGGGRVKEVSAVFKYVKDKSVNYDQLCFLTLTTESGLVGRVAQDVVAFPEDKKAILQFERGRVEWRLGIRPNTDQVKLAGLSEGEDKEIDIEKTRPDDFYQEILHIDSLLNGKVKFNDSPIRLERGLDTMFVLEAAHKSHEKGEAVEVRYRY